MHRHLQHLLGKALRDFSLIEPGDHILIGLSGGKDSLALLQLLGERMVRSGGRFQLEALHVRMANISYATDTAYLHEQARRYGIPLHVVETSFEPDRKQQRTPCFLCSWHRRKQLFEVAQRLRCNKIALGHHQDDILRTALMNLTFNGSFATMPVKLTLRKMPLTLIRPLALIPEADLRQWAAACHYQPVLKVCPHDQETNRMKVQAVAEAMEQLNPDYRAHLWRALLRAGALVSDSGLSEG